MRLAVERAKGDAEPQCLEGCRPRTVFDILRFENLIEVDGVKYNVSNVDEVKGGI